MARLRLTDSFGMTVLIFFIFNAPVDVSDKQKARNGPCGPVIREASITRNWIAKD
jgi:hypothetical protein